MYTTTVQNMQLKKKLAKHVVKDISGELNFSEYK